jgi:hypothetical protein
MWERIMRILIIAMGLLSGCALERAQVAQDAQGKMVGLPKEQVLSCMGIPAQKSVEGATEVWSYNSGNGSTVTSSFASANTMVSGNRYAASGSGFGSGLSVSSQKYCIVNVVMNNGRVSQINYSGPTGGPITGGEQCAFAVRNCAR